MVRASCPRSPRRNKRRRVGAGGAAAAPLQVQPSALNQPPPAFHDVQPSCIQQWRQQGEGECVVFEKSAGAAACATASKAYQQASKPTKRKLSKR